MRRRELGFNQGVSFQRPLPRSSLQLQPQRTVSAHSAPSFLGQCCVCLFSCRVICRICYKNFLVWDTRWRLGLGWELRGHFVLLKVCAQSFLFFNFPCGNIFPASVPLFKSAVYQLDSISQGEYWGRWVKWWHRIDHALSLASFPFILLCFHISPFCLSLGHNIPFVCL